jgi:hypothetical protein
LFRDYGLIFADRSGNYQDGQHRLFALKLTKATAKFWLVAGLDKVDLNMMVDSGRKRTNSQRFTAAGIKRAGLIVGAIEEILQLTDNWKAVVDMLMPDELFDFFNKNQHLQSLAESWATSGIEDIDKKILVADQHVFTKIDPAKSDLFFAQITHRQTLKNGDPLRAYFEMLKSDILVNDTNEARVKRYKRNGLLIAWNAHLKGEKLEKMFPTDREITLDGTGGEPEPFDEGEGEAEVQPEVEVTSSEESEEEV